MFRGKFFVKLVPNFLVTTRNRTTHKTRLERPGEGTLNTHQSASKHEGNTEPSEPSSSECRAVVVVRDPSVI